MMLINCEQETAKRDRLLAINKEIDQLEARILALQSEKRELLGK
jgi:hypothetical protein